jgi:hypothetical protein
MVILATTTLAAIQVPIAKLPMSGRVWSASPRRSAVVSSTATMPA